MPKIMIESENLRRKLGIFFTLPFIFQIRKEFLSFVTRNNTNSRFIATQIYSCHQQASPSVRRSIVIWLVCATLSVLVLFWLCDNDMHLHFIYCVTLCFIPWLWCFLTFNIHTFRYFPSHIFYKQRLWRADVVCCEPKRV